MRPVPEQWPISQPYGYDPTYPYNGGWHYGVDYGCPVGTPGTVCYPGVVVVAEDEWPDENTAKQFNVQPGAWGMYLEIERPDGVRDGYAHLARILVAVSTQVWPGEIYYETGASGFTYGPHLHRHKIINRVRVDPEAV